MTTRMFVAVLGFSLALVAVPALMHRLPSSVFRLRAPRARSLTLVRAVALASLLAACSGGAVASPGTEARQDPGTTSTNPPQATTDATESQAFALRPDGLGVVSFGVSVDDTVSSLTAHLGDPTSFTPATELQFTVDDLWSESDDGLGLVWDRRWHQTFCWEQLCTVFGGDTSDGLFFTGWAMSPSNQGQGLDVTELAPVPDVATREGIAIGSTVEEIVAAYPDITFFTGEGASSLFDIGWTPSGFTGIGVVGPGRLLTIEGSDYIFQLAAGNGPWLGCC